MRGGEKREGSTVHTTQEESEVRKVRKKKITEIKSRWRMH